MDLAICRHIKLGGGRCGSPALRGQHFCYFHAGAHRTIPSVNLHPNNHKDSACWGPRLPWPHPKPRDPGYPRNEPEEAAAIQIGFTRLIHGLTEGLLNVRQAKLMLAALHRAAANFRDRTATEDSAVTSNQLRLPSPGGCRAATSESRGG